MIRNSSGRSGVAQTVNGRLCGVCVTQRCRIKLDCPTNTLRTTPVKVRITIRE